LPLPAGPSSSSGFCSFAARKTILVITGSMKYPVALSRSISSSNDSNIGALPQPGHWNFNPQWRFSFSHSGILELRQDVSDRKLGQISRFLC
jgi:hypothetical protein